MRYILFLLASFASPAFALMPLDTSVPGNISVETAPNCSDSTAIEQAASKGYMLDSKVVNHFFNVKKEAIADQIRSFNNEIKLGLASYTVLKPEYDAISNQIQSDFQSLSCVIYDGLNIVMLKTGTNINNDGNLVHAGGMSLGDFPIYGETGPIGVTVGEGNFISSSFDSANMYGHIADGYDMNVGAGYYYNPDANADINHENLVVDSIIQSADGNINVTPIAHGGSFQTFPEAISQAIENVDHKNGWSPMSMSEAGTVFNPVNANRNQKELERAFDSGKILPIQSVPNQFQAFTDGQLGIGVHPSNSDKILHVGMKYKGTSSPGHYDHRNSCSSNKEVDVIIDYDKDGLSGIVAQKDFGSTSQAVGLAMRSVAYIHYNFPWLTNAQAMKAITDATAAANGKDSSNNANKDVCDGWGTMDFKVIKAWIYKHYPDTRAYTSCYIPAVAPATVWHAHSYEPGAYGYHSTMSYQCTEYHGGTIVGDDTVGYSCQANPPYYQYTPWGAYTTASDSPTVHFVPFGPDTGCKAP